MSELDCKSATFGEVKLTCTNFDSDWGACGSCQSCKSRLLIASYQARIEELEAALRKIADGDYGMPHHDIYRKDGTHSKHDRCPHGRWMYEGCENCVADFALKILQENTDVG